MILGIQLLEYHPLILGFNPPTMREGTLLDHWSGEIRRIHLHLWEINNTQIGVREVWLVKN